MCPEEQSIALWLPTLVPGTLLYVMTECELWRNVSGSHRVYKLGASPITTVKKGTLVLLLMSPPLEDDWRFVLVGSSIGLISPYVTVPA